MAGLCICRSPCICRNLRQNTLSVKPAENELAPGPADETFTSDSESPPGSAALFSAPTPSDLASAPVLTEEQFKLFMKTYMESVRNPSSIHTELRERALKARFPDHYFGKSHMKCYHFCQQFKDYFDTARTTSSNRTSFVASFHYGSISFRWTQ